MSLCNETNAGMDELRQRLMDLGWYHSIDVPGVGTIKGLQSTEQLQKRLAQFPIPQDLRGKRVLDIGAWDGWFSFEMERRGQIEIGCFSSIPRPSRILSRAVVGRAHSQFRPDAIYLAVLKPNLRTQRRNMASLDEGLEIFKKWQTSHTPISFIPLLFEDLAPITDVDVTVASSSPSGVVLSVRESASDPIIIDFKDSEFSVLSESPFPDWSTESLQVILQVSFKDDHTALFVERKPA